MSNNYLNIIGFLILAGMLLLLPAAGRAQETDSTYHHSLNTGQQRRLSAPGNSDRSVSDGMMNKNGTYDVPTPAKHYHHPFKGQYYLDIAMKAYRKSLGPQASDGGIWGVLNFLAPFIDNKFEFSVYKINDVPVVDRNNALFQTGD